MGEEKPTSSSSSPPPSQPIATGDAPSPPALQFDPSRMIGIIKRKALIKDLAALYHAECLAYCQELLELQRKWEEPYPGGKIPEDVKREMVKPPKRLKKTR